MAGSTRQLQLVIFITCSVVLNSISAFGKETKSNPLSVSNSLSLSSLEQMARTEPRRLTDLDASATSISSLNSNGFFQQQQQPSIYHSIIDRSHAAPSRLAMPVQSTTTSVTDLNTAAGHHHGHAHGKYYEYREVPKKKTWKFGYKRGNHKHHIERHEHGKNGKHPHFKTKVKWQDKKSKGKGIHLWDYNHHKKHHHYG